MDIGSLIKEINELEKWVNGVNQSLDELGAVKKDEKGNNLDPSQRILESNKEILTNFFALKSKIS